MKAYNIKWEIDKDDIESIIANMSDKDAANSLHMSEETYSKMSIDVKHDLIKDLLHHKPGYLDDIIGLPSEVEIPQGVVSPEDISGSVADWLSDTYGFCHEGFNLDTDKYSKISIELIYKKYNQFDAEVTFNDHTKLVYTDITVYELGSILSLDTDNLYLH